jgi:hypothetical protein
MSNTFVQLTDANAEHLYNIGYMNKGTLIKYKFLSKTILAYDLNERDNGWNVGIISHVYTMSFTRSVGLWQVKVDEKGIEERLEYIYDITVYTPDPSIPVETVSTESHEIYLSSILNKVGTPSV